MAQQGARMGIAPIAGHQPIDHGPAEFQLLSHPLDFRSADLRRGHQRGDHALSFYGGGPQTVARIGYVGLYRQGIPKCSRHINCEFTASRPPYAVKNIRALVYSLTENDNYVK
jgi:hypothetical protein